MAISIHAPLAGRDNIPAAAGSGQPISIHAPLAGRDRLEALPDAAQRRISIHAPLAGRDGKPIDGVTVRAHFNPRAPCGARPVGLRLRQSGL